MRFEPDVERKLRAIGWYPGRNDQGVAEVWKSRAADHEMIVHPCAEAAWAEFGKLAFAGGGRGITIGPAPFVIDPTTCLGSQDWLEGAIEDLGEDLSPLGQIEPGKAILVMAENGYVYATGDFDIVVGSSIEDALRRMVLGIRWEGEVPSAWDY
jgi:hypothetical protein